ncbi:MAG: hypothetical protein J1E34_06400 [Oscillospiraceae bacterium]|nr:hypothetical protein [Oscillospiraceae bacterium]
MSVTEKIAYIKGLMEGMELDKDAKETKLFAAILDALEDIALDLADNTDRIDAIDADLAELEDEVYEDDGWDPLADDWYDDDDEDDGVYEFQCPNCNETVFLDESVFEDDDDFELECPACGAKLDSFFEPDDEE